MATTSFALQALPSWNVRPLRSTKVHSSRSAELLHEVARSGSAVMSGFNRVSAEYRSSATRYSGLTRTSSGLSFPTAWSTLMRSMPPRRGTCACDANGARARPPSAAEVVRKWRRSIMVTGLSLVQRVNRLSLRSFHCTFRTALGYRAPGRPVHALNRYIPAQTEPQPCRDASRIAVHQRHTRVAVNRIDHLAGDNVAQMSNRIGCRVLA